jgi:hypothetical protein
MNVEADGEPLFLFTLPLLPGLKFSGNAGHLQRIDSDTANQSLIQNRLLMSGLPPLRADASEAELRADLDGILERLSSRDMVRPGQLLWLARVAPAAGEAASTSLVMQMNPETRQVTAKLSSFHLQFADQSEQLNSWAFTEIKRFESQNQGQRGAPLCFRHFERFGGRDHEDGRSRCKYGDRCKHSHKLEDLRRLQRRDRDSRLAMATAAPNPAQGADAGVAQPAQPADLGGPFEFILPLQPALCLNPSQPADLNWAQLMLVDGRTRDQSILRRRFVWSGLVPAAPLQSASAIHADLVRALESLTAQGVLAAADVEWLARVAEPHPSPAPPRLILQLREGASVLALVRRLPSTFRSQGQLQPWLDAELEELNGVGQGYVRVCQYWFAGLKGRVCNAEAACRFSHNAADLQRLIDRRARIRLLEQQLTAEEGAHMSSQAHAHAQSAPPR